MKTTRIPETRDDPVGNAYDRVRYAGHAYQEAHPNRLAVMATLFGMNPAPVERCRVLEIGCGEGDNLIPMAVGLPDSDFTGIDLANSAIEKAQAVIDRIRVRNVRVRCMDLMDIGPEFERFDYIIAHGFFSWVPRHVQEKLLNVCDQNLSPQGVAFVSYNTYPAGYFRQMSRDLMLFHVRGMTESVERVGQGKTFLKFMAESAAGHDLWKSVLQSEVRRLSKRTDNVTYHDELGARYSPVYVSEFIETAARHGLQFLSEARLADVISPALKPEMLDEIGKLAKGELVAYQQYLDFLLFRGFRRSLLCHADIRLHRDRLAGRVTKLWAASPLRKSTLKGDGSCEFSNSCGSGTMTTNNPAVIAALARLEELWPAGTRSDDLLQVTVSKIPPDLHSEAEATLAGALLTLAASGLLELRTFALRTATRIGVRPTASPLARLQAQEGTVITTMLHTQVDIQDVQTRGFLQLLDGSRDRRALAVWLLKQRHGISQQTVDAQVTKMLDELHRMGLLVD